VDCYLSVSPTTQLTFFDQTLELLRYIRKGPYNHRAMIDDFLSRFRWRLLVACLTISLWPAGSAEANEIRGSVQVVDGDTIKVAGKTIHLFGVDAPEIDQQCRIYQLDWPCGARAVVILERLIAEKPVRCEIVGQDENSAANLLQAHCFNFENVNLNAAIIGAGMAVPLLKQTRRYVTAGYSAQIQRLGLWSGRFILPLQWREGKRFRPLGQPFKRKTLKE
jgi:endonuclease YncB( thermonuclease family)